MTDDRTSMELPSDEEILITRTFRAPARIVFEAWTKPEHVTRWWAPKSRGVTLVQCEADLRSGGAYRYVLARGTEPPFAFHGTYVEISPPTRLVYTQRFEPSPGVVLPEEAVITVTFEELNGSTTLVARERYPSKEVRDGVLESGMEGGMREAMDQLDALVASLRG
jgi:uncharacterized protein YndB with AHSA1/START domain